MIKPPGSRQLPEVSEPDRPPPGLDTFDDAYEREFSYVARTLGRLGISPSDLPDAVHDVFVIVYRKWSDYDVSRPLRPWLFGIARRWAATARRKSREEPLADPERVPRPAVTSPEPYAERDLLWRALAQLDPDRRDVLVLHDLDGFTAKEIADALAVPHNTVRSRLRLARADLVAAVERLRSPR